MSTSLAPLPAERTDLASLSLADCPDLWTAVAAGIAHGLAPEEAIRSAFHKYLGENQDAIQTFEIANFYAPGDTSKAFVNYAGLIRLLTITVAEQDKAIKALSQQVKRLTAVLPYLPPSTE